MKTKMMVRICGAALAGLFAMGGVVAVPGVSPSTAMEVEAAVKRNAVNNTYYSLAIYDIKGTGTCWTEDWEPIHGEDAAVASVNDLNTKSKTYVVLDINDLYMNDPMWHARYSGPKKSDGTYDDSFRMYYNDMVASYPQLKTQIKNGWRDLSYNGIQKLIAAKVLPADCLVGRYSKAGAATTTAAPAAATATAATASTDNIKKLQAAVVELTVHPATVYNGVDYSKEFNAAYYYIANPDLQTAIGVNAQGLLQHYVTYGKKEGRLAIAK